MSSREWSITTMYIVVGFFLTYNVMLCKYRALRRFHCKWALLLYSIICRPVGIFNDSFAACIGTRYAYKRILSNSSFFLRDALAEVWYNRFDLIWLTWAFRIKMHNNARHALHYIEHMLQSEGFCKPARLITILFSNINAKSRG